VTGKIHGWRGSTLVTGVDAGEAVVEEGAGDAGKAGAARPAAAPCSGRGRNSGPFWPQAASTPAQARAAQAGVRRGALTRMGFNGIIDGL